MADSENAVVIIYWKTKDKELIKRMVDELRIPRYMSINHETTACVGKDKMSLLGSYVEQGLIELRKR